MAETTQSDSDAARTIFYVVAVLTAIYGLALLVFPQAMFTLSEDPGVPANPGWVRWAGGLLLGTAIAAWLAASNPESQRPLIVGLAKLHPDHSGFALQHACWRLPWVAIVELAADLGQRSPCSCDVVDILQVPCEDPATKNCASVLR